MFGGRKKIVQSCLTAIIGIAFISCSSKNGEELKTTTLTLESDEIGNVDLLLENAVNFSASDELAIEISQSGNVKFVFDTMIFFFL